MDSQESEGVEGHRQITPSSRIDSDESDEVEGHRMQKQ
jgi:hypothetical protein